MSFKIWMATESPISSLGCRRPTKQQPLGNSKLYQRRRWQVAVGRCTARRGTHGQWPTRVARSRRFGPDGRTVVPLRSTKAVRLEGPRNPERTCRGRGPNRPHRMDLALGQFGPVFLPPLLVDFDGSGRHSVCLFINEVTINGTATKFQPLIVILDGAGKVRRRVRVQRRWRGISQFYNDLTWWRKLSLGGGKEGLLFYDSNAIAGVRRRGAGIALEMASARRYSKGFGSSSREQDDSGDDRVVVGKIGLRNF